MLNYVYADNYKSLVNQSVELDRFGVLLGRNGTGKTALYEVLRGIRDLLSGSSVGDCFPTSSLTKFETREKQSFSLSATIKFGVEEVDIQYDLHIEHDRQRKLPLIEMERVHWSGKPLFEFHNRQVTLYRNDGSKGAEFPFGSSRSFIPEIVTRPENALLLDFRDWIQRAVLVRPDPRQMVWLSTPSGEIDRCDETGARYVDWLSHVLQASPEVTSKLFECIKEALPGFESFSLERAGNLKAFFLRLKNETGGYWKLAGDELSDGQKMLIFLYTLVLSAKDQLVFIDEPDNYISLGEMQPLLSLAREHFESSGSQLLVISHHSETIDYLSADSPFLFSVRDGLTRIARIDASQDFQGRSASEFFFDNR